MFFNNLIFSLLLISYCYVQNRFILNIIKGYKFFRLSDDNFKKPQAFHEKVTFRSGGIAIFCPLVIAFAYLFFIKNIYVFEFLSFCSLFFILGLIDDLKINLRPKFRLIIMTLFLIILVLKNQTYIDKVGIKFLNNFLEIDILSLIFSCLCFLFIINGSNLVDGFNGLLSIHSLIITIILFYINLVNDNTNLVYILFCTILILLVFIKFNFPNAKMFLGDSGAYLMGSIIALSVIKTSAATPTISPFFYCIILFYLFFEVFFSFFRKIIVARQSPLLPDSNHLHMLMYKLILKKKKSKLISNYTTSIYINLIYLACLVPGILFMKDGLFCKYYFLFLLISYIYFYCFLNKK